jgi:hypothetical protein
MITQTKLCSISDSKPSSNLCNFTKLHGQYVGRQQVAAYEHFYNGLEPLKTAYSAGFSRKSVQNAKISRSHNRGVEAVEPICGGVNRA